MKQARRTIREERESNAEQQKPPNGGKKKDQHTKKKTRENQEVLFTGDQHNENANQFSAARKSPEPTNKKKSTNHFRPLTGKERAEPVVRDVEQLVLVAADHGHGGGVRGGDDVLELLAREDVGGRKVSLGVAVLSGLGGGHVNHLTGAETKEQEGSTSEKRQEVRKRDNLGQFSASSGSNGR